MDLRFACALARTLSDADADGDEYEEDAAWHVRYQSCNARHYRHVQFVCDAEFNFWWTHATWHRPRRQFAAGVGKKTSDSCAIGRSGKRFSRAHWRKRN